MKRDAGKLDRAIRFLEEHPEQGRGRITAAAMFATVGTFLVLGLYLLYADLRAEAAEHTASEAGFSFLFHALVAPLAAITWITLFAQVLDFLIREREPLAGRRGPPCGPCRPRAAG